MANFSTESRTKTNLVTAVEAYRDEVVAALLDRRTSGGAAIRRKLQAALDAACRGVIVLDGESYRATCELRDAFDWWLEVRRLARPARQQESGYREHDVANAENNLQTKLRRALATAEQSGLPGEGAS
jgi:hypothetical protein